MRNNNSENLDFLYKKKGNLLKEIVALNAALSKARKDLDAVNKEIETIEG